MTSNVKISVRQFTVIVMFYTIGTTILVIPSSLAADADQDAWIAAILGWVLGLLIVGFYIRLGRLFPNMTLIEYNEKVFGKWLGKKISLFFIFFSFICAATVLYYLGNFMTTQVMPETPIESFTILFAGIVVMGLRLGLEVVARTAEILFPWFLLLFIVSTLFLIPEIEIQNIQPVFEFGIKPIMNGALTFASTASLPLVILLLVFPAFVNHPKDAGKAYFIGTLLGGLFVIIITFLSISILGADLSERNMYPSYALAKKIDVGNFIQRVEILIAGIWFMTIFFKTTIYSFSFLTGLAQIFGFRDYRPFALPYGMILVVYSLVVYPDVVYMMDFDSTIWIPYALTIGLLLPLIILSVGSLRKKIKK
ncbi:GerAB/ArcD/ProY family transporter [Paenibacillus prosopidis]|uniref:Spore germination protein KB n=1 Tax=Paenibacillus prosopidis TaxID=630520 RepID=A0A368W5K8_9BACL|nr:endospore germination permease [Paenibacillus prosopidis]RCW51035.1 spore germination protein KB [Paenibacillus prosopidis]